METGKRGRQERQSDRDWRGVRLRTKSPSEVCIEGIG